MQAPHRCAADEPRRARISRVGFHLSGRGCILLLHTILVMTTPLSENPFAILTFIAAPAVFTNASSVLALGTSNRLARVVDRTRQIAREIHGAAKGDVSAKMWVDHLGRMEKRGSLLVRAMSFFYGAVGCFAGASLISILGAALAETNYRLPFELVAGTGIMAGGAGFVGLVVGCVLLVTETRIALTIIMDEAELAKTFLK